MTETPNLIVYHHPYSRAANTVWMLEELGLPYQLEYVDILTGAQKSPEFLAKNPMGKLPTVVDGDVILTESAAIGIYLADRYSSGKLAPKLDDPKRATYLRWIMFAPSVIEPGCYAHRSKWEYKASAAGWGTYESMLASIDEAIGLGPWILGEQFTMADIIFGGTVRYMLQFGLLEERESFVRYAERLGARPASITAAEKNNAIAQQHGLG